MQIDKLIEIWMIRICWILLGVLAVAAPAALVDKVLRQGPESATVIRTEDGSYVRVNTRHIEYGTGVREVGRFTVRWELRPDGVWAGHDIHHDVIWVYDPELGTIDAEWRTP